MCISSSFFLHVLAPIPVVPCGNFIFENALKDTLPIVVHITEVAMDGAHCLCT